MKKVALFGGTFDPIHLGHLIMAQFAMEKMHLDEVIFIPSFIPPHKTSKCLFTPDMRLGMVRAAVKDNPNFSVSDFEVKKQDKSYSIDTVRFYRQKLSKQDKLFFIIGGDAVNTLHKWKEIEEIKKNVAFITVNRPGYQRGQEKGKYHSLTTQGIDISSTLIRRRIQQGKSIQYLVPDAVLRYISKHYS